MTKLYLVLAASGSGKTTVTKRLVSAIRGVDCLRFGDFLEAEIGVSRSEMRAKAGDLVSEPVVESAVASIRNAIAACTSEILLVECRNVAVRDFGLVVGYYAARIARDLPFAGIVFLDVSAEEIERRTASDGIARPWRDGIGASLSAWERAAAVALGSTLDCSVYVIEGDRPVDSIVYDIQLLLEDSGREKI